MLHRNELLDLETRLKVMKAAPMPTDYPPNEARMLINALKHHANVGVRYGMDERPYYEVLLAELRPDLPEALSPKRSARSAPATCAERWGCTCAGSPRATWWPGRRSNWTSCPNSSA